MDILNPNVVNIEGRLYCCYNSTRKRENSPEGFPAVHQGRQLAWDEAPEPIDSDHENDDIKKVNGRYQLSLSIPSAFFKYIIGPGGSVKKKLEKECGVRIQIPPKGVEGEINISSTESSSCLYKAKMRIEMLTLAKRWKEPFTHFISIALNGEKVKKNFGNFQDLVLKYYSSERGVEESIFQNPLKLHLTICILALLNEQEVDAAKKVLEDFTDKQLPEIIQNEPLEVEVKGLEYMNDDPTSVDVLYAKVQCVDGSDRLQRLADQLNIAFTDAGFTEKQYDSVKVHGTLMNTKLRKDPNVPMLTKYNKRSHNAQRETFNAEKILSRYEGFNFGKMHIREVYLTERFSGTTEDGFWKSASSIKLP